MHGRKGFNPLEKKISKGVIATNNQRAYRANKTFLTGFTLIELLVVIAIIALLMSILMPALAKARKMTKAAMCMSNLKQWGAFFSMYTDDYNGKFMEGITTSSDYWAVSSWWYALEPYYKDRSLLCCPMANNPKNEARLGYGNYGTWGPTWFPDGFYGSYGINEWVCNPVLEAGETQRAGTAKPWSPEKYWRSTNVKGQSAVPLLADAWWDQGWAEACDWIPSYPGEWEAVGGDDMAHFVIMRHDGFINMLFMDYTVRKIHLRELWGLRWNRLSEKNMDEAPTIFDLPPWLQKL